MKICQINNVYGVGSTGKLTRDLHHSLLQAGYNAIVIVPVKNRYTIEDGCFTVSSLLLSRLSAVLRRGLGMQYDWAYLQTHRIIKILKREAPDVVHLQCINGNNINTYLLYGYLAKNRIKTILTLHAEFPYTGGCGHAYDCMKWQSGCGGCPIKKEATQSPVFDLTARTWRKLKKAYSLFDPALLRVTAVSPWLKERASIAPLLSPFNKSVVFNGVDVKIFNYQYKAYIEKLDSIASARSKIVLYVTASFYPDKEDLKGGRYIVELAKRFAAKDVLFVVAANYGSFTQIPQNIMYWGRTKDQKELAALYSKASVTVITSKRETFSMPVAESLCCGTPIVGFKAGGPESIAISEYSTFVEYGDIDSLHHAVNEWLLVETDKKVISKAAQGIYSIDAMAKGFIGEYLAF